MGTGRGHCLWVSGFVFPFSITLCFCVSLPFSHAHILCCCLQMAEGVRRCDYGMTTTMAYGLPWLDSFSRFHSVTIIRCLSPFWMRKQWNTEEVWWDTHCVIMSVAHQRHLCLFKIFYTLPVDITRQTGKEENQMHLNNTPGTHPEYIFVQNALIDLVLLSEVNFLTLKMYISRYGALQRKDTLDYRYNDNVLEICYFWNSAVYKHTVLKKAILFQAGWVPHNADKNKCGPHLTIYSQARLMYRLNRN